MAQAAHQMQGPETYGMVRVAIRGETGHEGATGIQQS